MPAAPLLAMRFICLRPLCPPQRIGKTEAKIILAQSPHIYKSFTENRLCGYAQPIEHLNRIQSGATIFKIISTQVSIDRVLTYS